MTHHERDDYPTFGGLGGVMGGRGIDKDDLFEVAVERCLGSAIRDDRETAIAMWSALANQGWQHNNGDTASYSFRAAGDLVAAIRGSGDYLDWYCCGPETIRGNIEDALAGEGWYPRRGSREQVLT